MALPAGIGRYRVSRQLGAGAMGAVFLAEHPGLGREVAIKVLHDRDPEVVARFRREAEIMAKIRDPRVVGVYESGVHEGQLYLVMEFVSGRDLSEVLKERGALPPAEAAWLLAEVARGVAAAHAAGVVHRDLKPSNVLLGEDGRPRVTDFGISSQARPGGRHSLTETGVLLGTPAYMAPEQALDARDADARSDVYALGVILRECLTGERAFKGASGLAVLAAVIEGDATPLPSGLPEGLLEVVRVAMAREPGDRYHSAETFAAALEEGLAEGASSGSGRGRLFGAVLGLVVLGLALGFALRGVAPPREAPIASSSPVVRVSASPAPTAPGIPPVETRAYYADKARLWCAGVSELDLEARRGHPAAMLRLSRFALEGRPGAPPREEAFELLERAAEGGDAEAAEAWADLLARRGDGRAGDWLEKAVAWGSPQAVERVRGPEAALEVASARAKLGDPAAHAYLIGKAVHRGDRALALERASAAVAAEIAFGYAIRAQLYRGSHEPELAKSLEDFGRAAEAGLSEGYCGLARAYALGLGCEVDRERAIGYLKRAEATGDPRVVFERVFLAESSAERRRILDSLGKLPRSTLLAGELGLYMLDRAKGRSERLAAGGLLIQAKPLTSTDARVPRQLGILLASGVVRSTVMTQAQLFERAAKLGDGIGVYAYGDLLLRGKGGAKRDPAYGLELITRASDEGLAVASDRLGDLYSGRLELGVERDLSLAIRRYRKAGEQGQPESLIKAAELLFASGEDALGRVVATEAVAALQKRKSPGWDRSFGSVAYFLAEEAHEAGRAREAARWAERSVAEEHLPAFSLSARLAQGKYDPNPTQVAGWYRKAAEAGDPEGACGLARCLIEGRGVAQDLERARELVRPLRETHPSWVSLVDLRAAAAHKTWGPWRGLLERLLSSPKQILRPHQWGELALHVVAVRDSGEGVDAKGLSELAATSLGRARPTQSVNSHVLLLAGRFVEHGALKMRGPLAADALSADLYRKASNLGHPGGTLRFAQRLLLGWGVAKNVEQGLAALRETTRVGSNEAWVALGDLHRSGIEGHLASDLAEAERCYRSAAEAGFGPGCAKLGRLLLNRGQEEPGLRWVREAARAKDPYGESIYAECLLWGRGCEADPEAALATLRRLAPTVPYALQALSRAYAKGRGVERDPAEAKRYAEAARAALERARVGGK